MAFRKYAQTAFKDNAEMTDYFLSLNEYVQESIMQSGVELNTLEELKACAEHFGRKSK